MNRLNVKLLIFSELLSDIDMMCKSGNVVHILCIDGNFSFSINHTRYNVGKYDYVIFTVGALFSEIKSNLDCRVLLMAFPESMTTSTVFNSNYGILGHLSLLSNPVMHLSLHEFETCRDDMIRLCKRATESHHLFYDELLATLLKAHILDLYDIHARSAKHINAESRIAQLMHDFVRMLIDGDFKIDRSLEYYADKLCVTPHYLSEISKKISGQPASYWINQFFLKEVIRMILSNMSMKDIVFCLNISSVSYLTRYLKKQLGMTPSELKKGYFSKAIC